jgi:exodeoxyribonuclease VIII
MNQAMSNYQQEQAYHSRPEISRSDLINFRKSPAHYLSYKLQTEGPQSQALRFGEAYHLAILEPSKFEEFVNCLGEGAKAEPEKSWNTKANQAAKKALEQETPILLSEADYERVLAMRKALQEAPAWELLSDPLNSYEVERTGTILGVDCRAKFDVEHPAQLLDLKTCQDASPEKARKEVFFSYYYYQAGFYSLLAPEAQEFGFIFQEKEPPYCSSVIWVSEGLLKTGQLKVKEDLEQLKQCQEDGLFPGYHYYSSEKDGSFIAGD